MPTRITVNNSKRFIFISLVVLFFVFFFISHNTCWLNPSDHCPTIFFSIPYGWEYDLDSGLEIYSAINFPEGMIKEKTRIARPLKNALISAAINAVNCLHPLNDRLKIGMSYVIHHALNLSICIFLIVALVFLGNRYDVSFEGLSIAWIYILASIYDFLSISHTYLFQISISVVFLLVIHRIESINFSSKADRLVVSSVYAIFCGLFVLIKQDYAPYLAVILYYFLLRKNNDLFVWLVLFHLPYLCYRIILFLTGVEFYSHETNQYGQGIWFFTLFFQGEILLLIKKVTALIFESSNALFKQVGIVFFVVSIIGLLQPVFKSTTIKLKIFTSLLLGSTVIQTIAAARPIPYMFSDVVVPFALFFAVGYDFLMKEYYSHNRLIKYALWIAPILFFLGKIIVSIKLPWVSPVDQLAL